MRSVRLALWFVVGLLFSAWAVLSYAATESIDATLKPAALKNGYMQGYTWYSTAQEACNSLVSAYGWSGAGVTTSYASYPGQPYCYNTAWGPDYRGIVVGTGQSCGASGAIQQTDPAQCPGTYECPALGNWTLNGSKCERPQCTGADYLDPVTMTCKKDCTGKQGAGTPNGHYSTTGDSWTGSVGGCQIECSKLVSLNATASSSVTGATMSNCRYTGKSAQSVDPEATPETAPNPNIPRRPQDCTGAGQGYIQSSSGTITCVSSSDAPEGQKPVVKERGVNESGTPPAGSGSGSGSGSGTGTGTGGDSTADPTSPDYKKTEKVSSTSGGKTTTTETTTTNPDSAGNCGSGTLVDGKCVSTKVTTQNTSDFCTSNPNASVCKDAADQCTEHPERAACKDLGEPGTEPTVDSESRGTDSITTVQFAGSNSCPSPIALPKGASLSFQWSCDLATNLRPILLALAWLSAGLIVMGAFKSS